jgi:hypothetical protein
VAILDGRQVKGLQLEELTRAMLAEWGNSGTSAPSIDLKDKANDKTC